MLDPSAPSLSRPTTALVVEGGGLRGAFGAGVITELSRAGLAAFDDIVAVSAGAPSAAYLATGQAEQGLTIWREYTHGSQLISARNLYRGAPLLAIDRLVGVFQHTVPLDAAALGATTTRLWIAITDCETGIARYVKATPDNVFELLRATMALPVANGMIVPIDGLPSIDGGVVAPIPLHQGLALRRDRLLVVLTRPRGYRRPARRIASFAIGWTYPQYPAVRKALALRAERANAVLEQIEELERAGRIAVIRPTEPLPASRLSRRRDAIEATIECGRRAARAWLRTSPPWLDARIASHDRGPDLAVP